MDRLLRTTYTHRDCQHVDTHLHACSLHLRCQRPGSPCRNSRSRRAHRRTSSARSQSHTMCSTVTFTQMKPARSYGHAASAALSTRCTPPLATQNSLSRSHASSGPTCTPSPCVSSGLSTCRSATQARGRDHPRHSTSYLHCFPRPGRRFASSVCCNHPLSFLSWTTARVR
ncbi:hypothetical protein GGX14DRAFT_450262 [Mycena pura]|uniref:Uncharacterized protein n=1 Tax=Mycena pura TaxID=153505 RepID=A0AAD6VEK2_9AGAR|nr:hypothetical protein GGX14DRAFT_450262 [Mycena pura]